MRQSLLLPTLQRLHGPSITMAGYVDGDWQLPAYFGDRSAARRVIAEEYEALTGEGVAIADRSWRSTVELTGRDRQSFLQGMLTNDIAAFAPGEGCRAAMLGSNGQMLADVAVYCLESSLLLAVDPRAAGKLLETLDKYLIAEKVAIVDASDRWAVITVAGGGALAAIDCVAGSAALPDKPYGSVVAQIDGVPVIITRSGPRGAAAFDLHIPVENATTLWESLINAGARPAGEMALETVRIEAGDPAWGAELTDGLLFPEVELGEALSYTKGCYIGQEIVARIHARGHTNRALRGVLFDQGDHSMQAGDPLYPDNDSFDDVKEIGRITSVAASPAFDGRMLALAYVRKEFNAVDTPVICRYAHREAYGTVMTIPLL